MADQKKFYLTKKGLEDLKKECEVLKNLRNAKIKGESPKLWESEDLNPEYLSFQEDLEFLETRLAELENVLDNFSLIEKPSKDKLGVVDLGATVTVQVDGAKDEFVVVGTLEANPALGKISDESPVGHALLGSKVGDEIIISSPVKTIYKIEKIKYS